MAVFQVWAPQARKVKVQIGEERFAMKSTKRGWWRLEVGAAKPGTDYLFVLDDKDPAPDPRSPFQPFGVHGASRLVAHENFPWTDTHWQPPPLSSAIIYELHIGTFTPEGTFEAAIQRLDYLAGLGVTHVELMPVNEFSGSRGWGYDGVGLYAPHHSYGGPEGLKRLVDACHAKGLAVILDVVYNHLGPEGNYLHMFGPYFTDHYMTPWGEALNFDGRGSEEVRRFFIENALMWLRDYHFDGLRLDAIHAIIDTSALHILEELASEVTALAAQLGRSLHLIAESDLNDPRVVRSQEIGGYGIHAQWSDDFHHALHTVLTGERKGYYADFGALADLAKALQEGFVYAGRYSGFRGRRHGQPPTGLSGHHFVGYLQNHDQIGNRAQGDRSSQLMSPGRLKIAAAFVFTSPFIPMLFQGEEWGATTPFQYFTDHGDPELGDAVREGRRNEFAAFGWNPQDIPDPQSLETFQRSQLNWSELDPPQHIELLAWHRQLIHLRRQLPTLTDGRFDRVQTAFDDEARWFVLQRGPVVVACNLAGQEQTINLEFAGKDWQLLLASDLQITAEGNGVKLPPDSVGILRGDE